MRRVVSRARILAATVVAAGALTAFAPAASAFGPPSNIGAGGGGFFDNPQPGSIWWMFEEVGLDLPNIVVGLDPMVTYNTPPSKIWLLSLSAENAQLYQNILDAKGTVNIQDVLPGPGESTKFGLEDGVTMEITGLEAPGLYFVTHSSPETGYQFFTVVA